MAMSENERAAIEETLKAFESWVICLAMAARTPDATRDGLRMARHMLISAAVDTVTVLSDEHERQTQKAAEL